MIPIQTLLTILSVCAAIIFGYIAMQRGNRHDIEASTEERASMNAMVMTKLDNISENIADIKRDNKDLRQELQNLRDRIVVLEQTSERRGRQNG